MRDSTDGCTTLTVRDAWPYRQESLFSFQECIATPVGSLLPIIECREAMPKKADECGPRGLAQGRGERVFHT
ncbi:hypothetical protein [Burkholderia diffusa]|uniref:hypothetical protein n=1 Tax=Burkholderia diffusa TaxID=488732 RepID=UPI0015821809|nr:hypothetical protein [Burkholderia diffusa]